jgi:hypothetical protein
MYRVLVCGPRDFKDYEELKKGIESTGWVISEIIHGAATGADTLGGNYADEKKIKCKEFPAKWNDIDHPDADVHVNTFGRPYDKLAGIRRNTEMLNYLLAQEEKDGLKPACFALKMKTGGTENMIAQCKKADVEVFEYVPYVQRSQANGYLHEF